MYKSIEGVYRDGKIELLESPPSDKESRVMVTFLEGSPRAVELSKRGIDPQQAADLRARLSAFHEDWDRPEMDIYDED